jgi:hypothetical protein
MKTLTRTGMMVTETMREARRARATVRERDEELRDDPSDQPQG